MLHPVYLFQEGFETAHQIGIPGTIVLFPVLGTVETVEGTLQDRTQPLQVGNGIDVDQAEEDVEHLAEADLIFAVAEVGKIRAKGLIEFLL